MATNTTPAEYFLTTNKFLLFFFPRKRGLFSQYILRSEILQPFIQNTFSLSSVFLGNKTAQITKQEKKKKAKCPFHQSSKYLELIIVSFREIANNFNYFDTQLAPEYPSPLVNLDDSAAFKYLSHLA